MADTPKPRRALPLTRYQRLVLAMVGLQTPPRIVAPPGLNTTSGECEVDEAIREAGQKLSTATGGALGERDLRSALGPTSEPAQVRAISQIMLDEHRLVDLEPPAYEFDEPAEASAFDGRRPMSPALALLMRREKPKTRAQQQARKKTKASRQARKANRR